MRQFGLHPIIYNFIRQNSIWNGTYRISQCSNLSRTKTNDLNRSCNIPDGQNINQNTATVNGLSNGQYFVEATDDNNCSVTDSVQITEPEPLEIIPNFTPISCFGASDGSIYLTIENINNYTFQCNTNQTYKPVRYFSFY
jgi:hypothetical protein